MKDKLGRELRDLRVSVTDRCNFRCFFCMPPESKIEFLRRDDLLSYEEIAQVVTALAQLGVRKVRITGGEPLVRAHIENLVEMLNGIEGVEDVALTTNGYNLLEKAEGLRKAGLKRITVSLLSLKEEKFRRMIGRELSLRKVIEGIEEAVRVGFSPVKVNTVVVRGVNDDEVLDIAEFCRERGLVLRFIEYMDVGTLNGWSTDRVVTFGEILSILRSRYPLEEVGKKDGSETAVRFRYGDTGLEVGFIASVTKPFCRGCTRLRLSADGQLFTCLFSQRGYDLKGVLRKGAGVEGIRELVRDIWLGREDRYSELRWELIRSGVSLPKVEMFRVGG